MIRTSDLAPKQYVLDLAAEDGLDLSTVAGATLQVLRPDGTATTWTVAMSHQTPTTLRLTHPWAAGDIAKPGKYVIYARLTVPGGELTSAPQALDVRDAFDLST